VSEHKGQGYTSVVTSYNAFGMPLWMTNTAIAWQARQTTEARATAASVKGFLDQDLIPNTCLRIMIEESLIPNSTTLK
jgi:hypothetical protein